MGSLEMIGYDMPGGWQDPELLAEYGLSEEQLTGLPDSAIYALALESPFMRQAFSDTGEIETVIEAHTGLTKEAQAEARKVLSPGESGDKRGFELIRSEDNSIALRLTLAGKRRLAEEIEAALGHS